jgi:hypothetical protein
VEAPIFSVTLQRPDGTVGVDVNTEAEQVVCPTLTGRGRMRLHLERLDAAPGAYFVNVGLYAAGWRYAYDFHWRVYPVRVGGGQPAPAPWSPPRRWALLGPAEGDAEPAARSASAPAAP